MELNKSLLKSDMYSGACKAKAVVHVHPKNCMYTAISHPIFVLSMPKKISNVDGNVRINVDGGGGGGGVHTAVILLLSTCFVDKVANLNGLAWLLSYRNKETKKNGNSRGGEGRAPTQGPGRDG